jgi:regulator of cell morphogenesis and NO signaling
MENLNKAIVGQLVAENYHTAAVFKKFNIDFCCNGNHSIEDVCSRKNIDPVIVTAELATILGYYPGPEENYNLWNLDVLSDHIIKKHHQYVETQIPMLDSFLHKLCSVHGPQYPELYEIAGLFNDSAAELTMHMKKEELMLFPYINQLVKAKNLGTTASPAPFGTVANPVHMMMQEHAHEGERFKQISALSNNYTIPPDGCNTYKVTYALLKEFQDDLHLHIHLENNILFPKAEQLEKELTTVASSCSINR